MVYVSFPVVRLLQATALKLKSRSTTNLFHSENPRSRLHTCTCSHGRCPRTCHRVDMGHCCSRRLL